MNSEKGKIDLNKKYLETHHITHFIEEMMSAIIKYKPDEPITFIINFFQNKARENGLYSSSQFKTEICDSSNNTSKRSDNSRKNLSTSKSYDKPWLSGTLKKQICINNNENLGNIFPNPIETDKSAVDIEFKLVIESPTDNTKPINSTSPTNSMKRIRHSSSTKEHLLKIINDNRQNQLANNMILEKKAIEKEEQSRQIDNAIELAEDPAFYQNEFHIRTLNEESAKPQTGISIRKSVPPIDKVETLLKFGICANCTKFYHISHNELIHSTRNEAWNISKDSLIMDDLESASQVNGPRIIENTDDFNNVHQKKFKKKISVSDFPINSKAWQILDTNPEFFDQVSPELLSMRKM